MIRKLSFLIFKEQNVSLTLTCYNQAFWTGKEHNRLLEGDCLSLHYLGSVTHSTSWTVQTGTVAPGLLFLLHCACAKDWAYYGRGWRQMPCSAGLPWEIGPGVRAAVEPPKSLRPSAPRLATAALSLPTFSSGRECLCLPSVPPRGLHPACSRMFSRSLPSSSPWAPALCSVCGTGPWDFLGSWLRTDTIVCGDQLVDVSKGLWADSPPN